MSSQGAKRGIAPSAERGREPADHDAVRPLRVSIVINNYNYERFLREAVDSALGQTYPHTEVVVVDDGSTDGSRRILEAYGDRVRAVLKENGGQASALNAGFEASRGDLVQFLDADDVLSAEAAARVARAWRPGVAKVQFPLATIDGAGGPRGGRVPAARLPSGDLSGHILKTGRHPWPPTSGNAFHRETLERLLPIPERGWRILADSYLLTLSPLCGEILSLDACLGGYRVHGANQWAMETVDPERLRDRLDYHERKQRLLGERLPGFGIDVPDGWRLRPPRHFQVRLASLRLDPHRHPYAADRAWSLAREGVLASGVDPSLSWRKRLFFTAWFALAALLPAGPARRLIEMGFHRGRRPALLRRLMG